MDEAWIARASLAAGLALLAAGGLGIALWVPWWWITYDRGLLCARNWEACGLTARASLAGLCLQRPAGLGAAGDDDGSGGWQCAAPAPAACARTPLALLRLALALHGPLCASLLGVVFLACVNPEAVRRSLMARRCGLGLSCATAAVASLLAVSALGLFVLRALPCDLAYVRGQVEQIFGVVAFRGARLQDRYLLAPLAAAAAAGFDGAAACLALPVAEPRRARRGHGQEEAVPPVREAVELAAGGARYAPLPVDDPDGQPPGTHGGGGKLLGRFRQFWPAAAFPVGAQEHWSAGGLRRQARW